MMRRGYIDTARGQVHFRDSLGSGHVIVMLHQTASSSRMFEELASRLVGFRSIALDTPGFGNSDSLGPKPSIEDYAEVLAEAVDALGIQEFHLLGHHTGAAIATRWAAVSPARVLSLSLIGALGMGDAERERWREGIPEIRIDENGEHFRSAWERVSAIDRAPVRFPPSARLRHRESVDMLVAGPRWTDAYHAVFSHDAESALAAVQCPVLLICGEEDILRPYLERTSRLNSLIEARLTAGGAYLLDQSPDDIAPVISEFISRSGSRATPTTTPPPPRRNRE